MTKRNWCPIKNAPKDGTRLLLSVEGCVHIGKWDDCANFGNGDEGPGWQIFECEMDHWYSVAVSEADGWMPLPEPPK